MIRLFVALPLPETTRDRLARLQSGLPGARWVAPDNMHVTLRFIGEVDEGTAQDIDTALDGLSAPGFTLTLSGLGSFGKGHRSRALWAGVDRTAALQHLRDKVESAVVRAGQPAEERKFSPHVTLARLGDTPPAKLARFLEAHGMLLEGPLGVDRFCLYESVLGRSGPTYHELRSYPLQRATPSAGEPEEGAGEGP